MHKAQPKATHPFAPSPLWPLWPLEEVDGGKGVPSKGEGSPNGLSDGTVDESSDDVTEADGFRFLGGFDASRAARTAAHNMSNAETLGEYA